PNPFNSQTMITYDLPRNESANLKIYDILGKEVITLINERKPAGIHRIIWNGQNNEGGDVTSGIYFICLNTERILQVRKVLLVR
ncbi:MAG: T9SS type A sorting domain-containing protein, partial [Candidatus Lokiarchaeota archaeon]|nr:T9SS type A sorting domain-containing protein [Candidatus Lokiarchaeota archaeon]